MSYHECENGERGEVLTDERGTYCNECGVELTVRPEFVIEDVETFSAVEEPGAEPLVVSDGGCVIPVGGLVLVYGGGGVAKTTTCIDWAFHFASGLSWLDILEPTRPLTVLIVENEGPRPEFRKKIRRRLDAWNELEGALGASIGGRLRVVSEPWAKLTFAELSHRDALAESLADVDLVIAGPLSWLGMEGGGTLGEVRDFVSLMQEVRDLAQRPIAFILVHHENKAGSISGAWEGATDATVHVQALGHGRTRLFWQKVRWSSSLHQLTTNLVWAEGDTFTVEEREEVTVDTMTEGLLEAVRLLPGSSWSRIRELRRDDGTKVLRGNLSKAESIRDRLITEGRLVNDPPRAGQFRLWVADDPAATRSDVRTGLERPPFSSPMTEDVPSRSPVPPIRGTGDGTERPMGALPLAEQPSLTDEFGRCKRHPNEPASWCLECRASAA